MIHGLPQKLLLWLACPDRSHLQRIILVAFNTWYDNMENCTEGKKKKNAQQSIQYTAWPLGRSEQISPSPAGVILLVLVSRRRPLLMPADRSLLAGGDSWRYNCFRIPREVCLHGVVSPPICALRRCPLMMPKHRQFEMAIGEL